MLLKSWLSSIIQLPFSEIPQYNVTSVTAVPLRSLLKCRLIV